MMGRPDTEVIAGVNLPMLVKLGHVRSSRTLAECVAVAEQAGRKYIAAASHLPQACLGGAACCQSLPAQPVPQPASQSSAAKLPPVHDLAHRTHAATG